MPTCSRISMHAIPGSTTVPGRRRQHRRLSLHLSNAGQRCHLRRPHRLQPDAHANDLWPVYHKSSKCRRVTVRNFRPTLTPTLSSTAAILMWSAMSGISAGTRSTSSITATPSASWVSQIHTIRLGANQPCFSGINGPYTDFDGQQRRVPVPVVRDDFNWQIGKHSLTFGGTFKFIKTNSTLINNFNFVGIGLQGARCPLAWTHQSVPPTSTMAPIRWR